MAKKKRKEWDPSENAQDDLKGLTDTIKKKFGNGALVPLGKDFKVNCDAIPSGSISLDYIMGVGGWPQGRVCEVMGPEASGKTTLALQAIAGAQRKGLVAAFVDAEHALDVGYARKIGVDTDSLLLSQPDYGEQALEIVDLMVASGQVGIVVIDSVAALTPLEELQGEITDNHIGAQARMMSRFLRQMCSRAKNQNVCLIFINQIRQKIGVMMGSPETTPGGKALKFYSSMRVDVRKIGQIKNGDDIIGHEARIKIVKNKVAIPFKVCEVSVIYGQGMSLTMDIIELGCKYNLIHKSGSWYSYGDVKIGQGQNAAMEFLLSNDEIRNEIEAKIRAEMFGDDVPIIEDDIQSIPDEEVTDEKP